MEEYRIANPALADQGKIKIAWAWSFMPVLKLLQEKFKPERSLNGVKIAACLHLEAKTACLLRALKALGAEVMAAGSNPLSTQDDICAALVANGIRVYSWHGMTMDEYYGNLHALLAWSPQILIDDGGDLVTLIHKERSDLLPYIKGGCEETTTGIKRLKAMSNEGILAFPMLAVNDALSKHLFDNRYGTGQSVWDAICRLTNMLIAGKEVVVCGYGWCGRGVASRASGLGAQVTIVESDPHRALEAYMDGFNVTDMATAARTGDIFVTTTGNINVIRKEHFALMKNGAILANAGHFDVEISCIDLGEIAAKKSITRPGVTTYTTHDGRSLHLLVEGRLVNLAGGDGHPIEIMDLSFALQLLSVLYIHENDLEPGLYPVPYEIDRAVASYKLEALGIKLEQMTPEQEQYLGRWEE
jgi:adenosylhomocysteinase